MSDQHSVRSLPWPTNGVIAMYGTAWCPDCHRAKQFLSEQRVPYTFTDVDGDPAGRELVEQVNEGKLVIPVLLLPDGRTLVEPSNAELAQALGLQTTAERSFYDLIVVGSGVAGLTAALYAAREGIPTLVIERGAVGGAIGTTDQVDNFPGFPDGIKGADFADRLRRQAVRFGVEILAATEVESVSTREGLHGVRTATGDEYRSHALLIATGSTYRRLGIPGEADLIGAGVHFCATCDGAFYRDQDVLVVGGGNSATEESLFLTSLGQRVTLVTDADRLTASRAAIEKVERSAAIDVRLNTRPVEFLATDGKLREVVLENSQDGGRSTVTVSAAFVFIGMTPNSRLLSGMVELDSLGFVVTDSSMQTTATGVFVAGDVRSGSTKQAAAAGGEGAAAALAIRRHLESLGTTMRPNVVDLISS
jgi:thioredoxin reductase (NADPH)